MTRKHFRAIAKVIHDNTFNADFDNSTLDVIDRDELIEGLANIFKELNPKFNKDIFIDACIDND